MRITSPPALGLALWVVAGCSGGSGAPDSAGAPGAELNAASMMTIARATLTAVARVEAVGGLTRFAAKALAAGGGLAVQSGGAASAGIEIDQADIGLCRAGSLAGNLTPGASGNLHRGPADHRADGLEAHLRACEIDPGIVLTGGIGFRVERVSDAPGGTGIDYVHAFALRDLLANISGQAWYVDGDLQSFFDSTDPPVVFAAISGRGLRVGLPDQTTTVRNYDFGRQVSVAGSGGIETVAKSFDGYLASSLFNGELRFQTLEPFVYSGRHAVSAISGPAQGRLVITGARNAVLEIAVRGNVVILSLDADGDGQFDDGQQTTWQALTGLLAT